MTFVDASALAASLQRAQAAYAAGDLAGARVLAEGVLARRPGDPLALQISAVVARREGRLDAARRLFEAALAAAPADPAILGSYAALLLQDGDPAGAARTFARAAAAAPADPEIQVNLGLAHKRAGDLGAARWAFERALALAPDHRRALHGLGVLLLELGELDGAAQVLDALLRLEARNVVALRARAQVAAEAGEDARSYIVRAQALSPTDANLAFDAAMLDLRDGDVGAAEARLERLAAADPGRAEVQAALAKLRWERGDGEAFTRGYAEALARRPGDPQLWLGRLGALIRAGSPQAALAHLVEAAPHLGPLADGVEAAAASEAGELARAEAAFGRCDLDGDPGLQISWLRHLLRTGRPDAAAAFAEPRAAGGQGGALWPYLATAWRQIADPRWPWLEGQAGMIRAFDLPMGSGELADLADVLRGLHRTRRAPFDQSLRGGTQTQGALLSRREPEIRRLRSLLEEAVRAYAAGLPTHDPRHPLLAPPRDAFRFAGSWSVRLQDAGFHANHVHTTGWISSAFYVALPDEVMERSLDRAGWLVFGEPPTELGLDLEPFDAVAPKAGRLALFPSTVWHGTRPFAAGERLTVAFDAVPAPKA